MRGSRPPSTWPAWPIAIIAKIMAIIAINMAIIAIIMAIIIIIMAIIAIIGPLWTVMVSFVAEAFIMTTYIVTDLSLFIIVICQKVHHDVL